MNEQYYLPGMLVLEENSCKYLAINLHSDFSWVDQVNYMVQKAWKALHFIMQILRKGTSNTKTLAYISLVRPILEYGAACWDPYREGQISKLDRVQKKAAEFAHLTNTLKWETLAPCSKIACLGALYKPYCGERVWKDIGGRM